MPCVENEKAIRFDMPDGDTHVSLVVLIPEFNQLRELSGRVGYVELPRPLRAGFHTMGLVEPTTCIRLNQHARCFGSIARPM